MPFRCPSDVTFCSVCFCQHSEHTLCNIAMMHESVPPPFFWSVSCRLASFVSPALVGFQRMAAMRAAKIAKLAALKTCLLKLYLREAMCVASEKIQRTFPKIQMTLLVWQGRAFEVVPRHVLHTYPATAGRFGEYDAEMQRELGESSNVPEPASVVNLLRARQGRTKVPNSGESRIARERKKKEAKIQLVEHDVFHAPKTLEKIKSILPLSWRIDDVMDDVQTSVLVPSEQMTVRMPKKLAGSEASYCFTILPTASLRTARKTLEAGWRNTDMVAVVIHIQSHMPQGVPIMALCVIRDTRTTDIEESILCGAWVDLGAGRSQLINLPLVNYPLNDDCVDEYLTGICLCTIFHNVKGYGSDTIMFSYGIVNFVEHKRNTHTDMSLMKNSWAEITARNNRGDPTRIVGGLGVLKTLEKDMRQELPDIPVCAIPPLPNVKPGTVKIGGGVVTSSSLLRQNSFQLGRMSMGEATGRNPTVQTWEAARKSADAVPAVRMGRRATRPNPVATGETSASDSTENIHTNLPPELGGSGKVVLEASAGSDGTDVLFIANLPVPKDAKRGKNLGALNVRNLANTFAGEKWQKWMRKGIFRPKLQLRFYVPKNAFTGLALSVHADFYGVFPTSKFGGDAMFSDVLFTLPSYIVVFRDGFTELEIDTQVCSGHNFSTMDDVFGRMYFYISVATTNQVPFAANWNLRVICNVLSDNEESLFALSPIATYPLKHETCAHVDRFYGPFAMAQGKDTRAAIPLCLAAPSEFGGFVSHSFSSALFSHWQGYGGTLKGRIIPTSSFFVSCTLIVAMRYGRLDTYSQLLKQPHCILDDGGEFELDIRSPFGTTSSFDDRGACVLYVCSLSGPTAPENYTAKYEFFLYFDSIKLLPPVTPVLDSSLATSWCVIDKITVDNKDFCFPARMCDLTTDTAHIVTSLNPFGLLIATTGMHRGRAKLVVKWSCVEKQANTVGEVELSSRYSTNMIGNSVVVSIWEGHAELDLVFGSQAGPVSASDPNLTLNWARLWTNKGTKINKFFVNIFPEPGFEFYGRSAYFAEIPWTATESVTEKPAPSYAGCQALVLEADG
uniref:Polyprotein n=1 Tax=Rhododendron lacteum nepovirus TaxID=3115775 RepID=A0AAT9JAT2_9SECO